MSQEISTTPVLAEVPFNPVVARVGHADGMRDRRMADTSPAPIEKPSAFPDPESAKARLAAMRGTVIVGDIFAPLEKIDWTADADNL